MIISYDEAREMGMIAFENSVGSNDNPFKRGTHMHIAWSDGWNYARFMSE